MKPPLKRSPSLLFPAFILILLAAGVLWFLFNRDKSQPPPQITSISEVESDAASYLSRPEEAPGAISRPGETTTPGPDDIKGQIESVPLPTLPDKENLPLAAQKIQAFYQYLDEQDYIRAAHLEAPGRIYFTELLQKLLDSPPVVIREADDLYTILQNRAHFYRILGKDDIFLLKDVMTREKDKIEDIVANYLILSAHASNNDLALKISNNAMYEYACFFLNTMGGKMYLSRRDSLSRMLVNYYAILIVDQANINEKNIYGLPLQPAIDLLTAEIETGGNQLLYKEQYLDTLYNLKEKYQ